MVVLISYAKPQASKTYFTLVCCTSIIMLPEESNSCSTPCEFNTMQPPDDLSQRSFTHVLPSPYEIWGTTYLSPESLHVRYCRPWSSYHILNQPAIQLQSPSSFSSNDLQLKVWTKTPPALWTLIPFLSALYSLLIQSLSNHIYQPIRSGRKGIYGSYP